MKRFYMEETWHSSEILRFEYNKAMNAVLQFVANAFVVIFFIGVVGSMVVVVISFFEDLELLVETDDEPQIDAALPRA